MYLSQREMQENISVILTLTDFVNNTSCVSGLFINLFGGYLFRFVINHSFTIKWFAYFGYLFKLNTTGYM